jgi:hypothetical protein
MLQCNIKEMPMASSCLAENCGISASWRGMFDSGALMRAYLARELFRCTTVVRLPLCVVFTQLPRCVLLTPGLFVWFYASIQIMFDLIQALIERVRANAAGMRKQHACKAGSRTLHRFLCLNRSILKTGLVASRE